MRRLTVVIIGAFLLTSAPLECWPQEPPDGAGGPAVAPPQSSSSDADVDSASSDESAPAADQDESSDQIETTDEEGLFDTAHRSISESVLATADWIDSFFSDERIETENKRSRLRLRFSTFTEDGSGTEFDTNANVRLDLPLAKDRLYFLISGNSEEDQTDPVPQELQKHLLEETDENVSAGFRYFLESTLKRNVSVSSGLRVRSWTPYLFIEPRYRQSVPFGEWLFRFTQRFTAESDGSLLARTSFDFERKLRETFFFRTSLEGAWSDDENGFSHGVSLALYQPLSKNRVLQYTVGTFVQTRPNYRLEEVRFAVRYRQRILRDWLYYSVNPQISFPRDRNFDVTPGILLRLEVLFGDYY